MLLLKVFRIIPEFRILRQICLKVDLKMLNWADHYTVTSDLNSVCLQTIDHLNYKAYNMSLVKVFRIILRKVSLKMLN